jgi:hypothetical protein
MQLKISQGGCRTLSRPRIHKVGEVGKVGSADVSALDSTGVFSNRLVDLAYETRNTRLRYVCRVVSTKIQRESLGIYGRASTLELCATECLRFDM